MDSVNVQCPAKSKLESIAAHCVVRVLLASGIMVAANGAIGAAPATPEGSWYITGSAGALLRSDNSFTTTLFNGLGASGPGHDTDTFNPGPVVSLGAGYRLPWGFRIEGEVGYATYTTASIHPLSTNGQFPQFNGTRLDLQSGAEHDLLTATANAFFDLPLRGPFVPYLGAGFGIVHQLVDDGKFSGPGVPRFTQSGGSTTDPVAMAEIGLTIRITEGWAVVPAYRFEHIFETNTFDINILKIGARYSF